MTRCGCRYRNWHIGCWKSTGSRSGRLTDTSCGSRRSRAREYSSPPTSYLRPQAEPPVRSIARDCARLRRTSARSTRSCCDSRSSCCTDCRNCRARRPVIRFCTTTRSCSTMRDHARDLSWLATKRTWRRPPPRAPVPRGWPEQSLWGGDDHLCLGGEPLQPVAGCGTPVQRPLRDAMKGRGLRSS
jgi:hypothetical protein